MKTKKDKGAVRFVIREIGPYIDLGMSMAVSMTVGVLGGLWLDKKIHTTPLFLLIGFFFGATAGFWSIYRTVYLKDRKDKNEHPQEHS